MALSYQAMYDAIQNGMPIIFKELSYPEIIAFVVVSVVIFEDPHGCFGKIFERYPEIFHNKE